MRETSDPTDIPLYCERCRRVTTHYQAEPPLAKPVWICEDCALIDALVDTRTLTPYPDHENDRARS